MTASFACRLTAVEAVRALKVCGCTGVLTSEEDQRKQPMPIDDAIECLAFGDEDRENMAPEPLRNWRVLLDLSVQSDGSGIILCRGVR